MIELMLSYREVEYLRELLGLGTIVRLNTRHEMTYLEKRNLQLRIVALRDVLLDQGGPGHD